MRSKYRRSFLKLSTSLAAGTLFSSLAPFSKSLKSSQPGVIIIVLDALSARNMSLYGYHRKTTPSFERIASRANVYHAHHSAGTFTTAGTSSLLTGTYPWTHRAINLSGLIARDRYKHNIFSALGPEYVRTAFTQNYFASYILSQFTEDIETYFPIGWNSVLDQHITNANQRDFTAKFRAFDDFLFDQRQQSSLLFGYFDKLIIEKNKSLIPAKRLISYQDKLFFNFKNIFTGIGSWIIKNKDKSIFSYFHLYPPHAPYQPKNRFKAMFYDSWRPINKPMHPLGTEDSNTYEVLNAHRTGYDQYITMADAYLGYFFDQLYKSSILNNNYLVLTSDHGESLERGYRGHAGPLVYEPSIQVPLLILSPGQKAQNNFYTVTNSIDVVPTLLSTLGYQIPDWCEGEILPGFNGFKQNDNRITFSMDAKESSAFGNLENISVAMFYEKLKLIYYKYENKPAPFHDGTFELYDLKNDPEELNDLFDKNQDFTKTMLDLFNSNRRDIGQ